MSKKENLHLPDYKDQVTSANRRPPRRQDPDGPLVDADDDATRAPTVSGEASTVVADTVVEPSPIPSNNNNNDNIREGDVSIRILPPSTRTTLAENHNPNLSSPSATSPATLIPIAFVVPDADINSNEAATPTQTNRDHRPNRFALVLASLTVIAVAGIVVVGVVCGSGDCSGGGPPTEAAPMMAPRNVNTTPSPNVPTILPPVNSPTTASPTTNGAVPVPAPLPVPSPAPVAREQDITTFINTKSYTGMDLSPTGNSPEERAMQWLINDDPLKLNVGGDESDEFRLLQRYSLMTLWFQADTGTAWSTSTNWTNADECTWLRIVCNEAGIVQRVRISQRQLRGTLSPDLGLLTDLTRLQLDYNSLSGSLPTEIGYWTSLTYFDVSDNSLTGLLPTEIGLWTSLTLFSFSYNSLAGSLPTEIGLWTSLTSFSVSGNSLTGLLPTEIGLWTRLTSFYVSGNSLTGLLPTEIGLWTSLTSFSVSGNGLAGSLPTEIGLWTSLTYFYVSVNSLTGTIPETIANWSLIEVAVFIGNNFTGSMPEGICEFISAAEYLVADCVTELECSCCTECY